MRIRVIISFRQSEIRSWRRTSSMRTYSTNMAKELEIQAKVMGTSSLRTDICQEESQSSTWIWITWSHNRNSSNTQHTSNSKQRTTTAIAATRSIITRHSSTLPRTVSSNNQLNNTQTFHKSIRSESMKTANYKSITEGCQIKRRRRSRSKCCIKLWQVDNRKQAESENRRCWIIRIIDSCDRVRRKSEFRCNLSCQSRPWEIMVRISK